MANQPFEQNGIKITPENFKYGDMIRITYDGELVKAGADKIWLYNTFNNEWKTATEDEMQKNEQGAFEINLPLDKRGYLQIAFRDSANHWDSNYGNNYSIQVQ
ncbi:MAG: hypothetical protein PWR27_2420 [Petroclostridium sp.]|jgi:hypothetical protein|uniref:carbohydrate-binding protein n=1 Tax=Petroclostridium xylanilyticum TaxID=1792311 RepID=UPI000B9999F6|nr:carbohydrate-binding protein [Petroclostridium xylanilyticum]MBZ4647504.1 Starch/carbohydrate-binding module (family 53) [Clostridia bacterium]MDK2811711.1 hypothetical protein [Petroclostridium sp.]